MAQIGQCVALPDNKPYTIRMTMGGFSYDFEPMPQKNPSNYKRYGRTPNDTIIELPYVNIYDFGKVIF